MSNIVKLSGSEPRDFDAIHLALSNVYLALAELMRSFDKLTQEMEVLSSVVADKTPRLDA